MPKNASIVLFIDNTDKLTHFGLSELEVDYINAKLDDANNKVCLNRLTHQYLIVNINYPKITSEVLRNNGAWASKILNDEKVQTLYVVGTTNSENVILDFLEGFLIASYRFNKYKTEVNKNSFSVNELCIVHPSIKQKRLDEIMNLFKAVSFARDIVNETPEYLTADKLVSLAVEMVIPYNVKTTVLNKQQIKEAGMGGVLAVNRGSELPPSFAIFEWKPESAVNDQPYVIIGKGVVYDTGGINLKTMPGSLDDMKCDMGGAAAVAGLMAAIAMNQLPIHVIGLIPATDNRPGYNAYVPGDVITMHSGLTVEVMNTDAEGRMILADALSYAKQYNPQLTIDLATLTGSAVMTFGSYAMAGMGTAENEVVSSLSKSAENTGERIGWLPFWDVYDELIKSEVADMKNIGGREAGAITAGKFLSRFIQTPWIHLDIAGPAFLTKPLGYYGVGATGSGIRLLYDFFKAKCH